MFFGTDELITKKAAISYNAYINLKWLYNSYSTEKAPSLVKRLSNWWWPKPATEEEPEKKKTTAIAGVKSQEQIDTEQSRRTTSTIQHDGRCHCILSNGNRCSNPIGKHGMHSKYGTGHSMSDDPLFCYRHCYGRCPN